MNLAEYTTEELIAELELRSIRVFNSSKKNVQIRVENENTTLITEHNSKIILV